ncbi:MAG: FecR family protein [Verrucomicrobiota bacterium]
MKTSTRLILSMFGFHAGTVSGAPLSEGEFTKVINDVRILPVEAGPVPAKAGDKIRGRTAVSTGAQSRAELRFSDNTLTRLGANSVFRMDHSTRTVDVEKGVILLQVPKQMGGAKVRTAAVTAAVTGTTLLLEYTADGFIKIIVIEGEVDVSLNERRNQFRTLIAGDMWITRANDKTGLPLPVQVDLERLKKTSKLLSAEEFGPLGNQKQLEGALKEQGQKKSDGDLLNTSFQIEGRGRNVSLLLANRQHISDSPEPSPPPEPPVPPDPPIPEPNKSVLIPGTTVFDNRSIISTFSPSNAYNSLSGGFAFLPGSDYVPEEDGSFGSYMYGDSLAFQEIDEVLSGKKSWFALKGDEIYISGGPSVDSTGGPRNLILGATGNVNFTANPPFAGSGVSTGNLWTLDGSAESFVFTSLAGSINFDGFKLIGDSHEIGFHADGASSDVNLSGLQPGLISMPNGTFEATAGRDINLFAGTVEATKIKLSAGRDLRLGDTTAGAAKLAASGSISLRAAQGITISNSSELRRLSQLDNPQVMIEAVNGAVEISGGSTVDADVVGMTSQRGDIRLVNSSVAAREIKARVFDGGGTLLLSDAILGRGTNASDLIRLYGEGSGGVRFVGDTTLRGNTVDIAGTSVTIDPGSRVRLSNPNGTNVFADSHLYNNGSNGNFTGLSNSQNGGGPVNVNQQPFSKRPGY